MLEVQEICLEASALAGPDEDEIWDPKEREVRFSRNRTGLRERSLTDDTDRKIAAPTESN